MESAWGRWSSHALPGQTSLSQRASMKTAFMSGAALLLWMVLEAGDEQERVVTDLGEELTTFVSILQTRVTGETRQ